MAKLKGPDTRGKSAWALQAMAAFEHWREVVNFDGIWRLKLVYVRIAKYIC